MSETGKLMPVDQRRLVRALRRCKNDGWPRCPQCGKRMRPYMGNMRDHGTAGPQNWQCDAHFLPSYYGTAQGVIDLYCSPNAQAMAAADDQPPTKP